MSVALRAITGRDFRLAENPLWDPDRRRLLWTDIDAGELWSFDPARGSTERLDQGPLVGGFTLQRDGSLLLFRERDVALWSDGRAVATTPFDDDGTRRFNDVIATPGGAVLAGTYGRRADSGGLFLFDRDARPHALFRGTQIANGLGFSPDRRVLYWTDSTARRIDAFAFDAATDALSGRRALVVAAGPDDGIPDGLTVDDEGFLWSARWGGGKVVRHGADGRPVLDLAVPTRNVTSVAFGGPDLRTLYITTAGGPVYACEPGPRGVAEFRSDVRLPR